MVTALQIGLNAVLVFFGVALVAGALTFAGHALAAEAAEDDPEAH